MNELSLPERLRSVAQNDYMIDEDYLDTGYLLNTAAREIERLDQGWKAANHTLYALRTERDGLRGMLESTTSLLDRCAERLPDPVNLKMVLQLAEWVLANVEGYGPVPDFQKSEDAIFDLRGLLKGVAV